MPFIYLPTTPIFAKKESDNPFIAWQRHIKKDNITKTITTKKICYE